MPCPLAHQALGHNSSYFMPRTEGSSVRWCSKGSSVLWSGSETLTLTLILWSGSETLTLTLILWSGSERLD